MHLLMPLASLLGLEVGDLTARLKRQALAWSAIGAFGLIGVVFLLVALNNAALLWLGPMWGPLAVAGGGLFIALLIFAGVRIASAIVARQKAEKRHAAERTALVTSAAVTALPMLLKSPLMKQIGIPVGGALAALYLLRKPGGYKDD